MVVTLLGSADSLDRQSGRRGDSNYLTGLLASPLSRFTVLSDLTPLVFAPRDSGSQPTIWLPASELDAEQPLNATVLFLGVCRTTHAAHFALEMSPDTAARLAAGNGVQPTVDFRTLASSGELPSCDIAHAGLARSLFAWHNSAFFCGWCGSATMAIDGGWKRRCNACAREAFPRLDPVVIMLVTDGERCILAHEPRYRERMYSCPAGYIEPGEDIAHAVARETFEELGLTVIDVAIFSSQPWPFPHSLMIGCVARCTPGPVTLDPTEILDARWFTRREATHLLANTHPEGLWVPGPQAIAHHLIQRFAGGE